MKLSRVLRCAVCIALIAVMLLAVLPGASAAFVDMTTAAVAGGTAHSLVVTKEGKVLAWGTNEQKQLGMDDARYVAERPKEVNGITNAIAVAAGGSYSAALLSDGTVSVWGSGNSVPQTVPGLSSVVQIDAGLTDILALKKDGTVWQWMPGGTPVQVPNLYFVAKVSAGMAHFLAITTYGDIYAWGDNSDGRLGDGTTTRRETPVKLDLANIVDIAAGYNHSLAVDYDGNLYSWGSNDYGQLGEELALYSATPIRNRLVSNAARVAAGNSTTLVLTDDGLMACGWGEYGQNGNTTTNISEKSLRFVSHIQGDVEQVACGVNHDFYVTTDGTVFGWGRNQKHQVGTQTMANVLYPLRIDGVVATSRPYRPSNYLLASSWAIPELEALYLKEAVPPMLWNNYKQPITRAEFSYMLVSVYEYRTHAKVVTKKATEFKDLKNHKLGEMVNKAYTLEFINGLSQTEFAPDKSVSRQEAAKMISCFYAKLKKQDVPMLGGDVSNYRDAGSIRAWAIPYVAYARDMGILTGTDDGMFKPQGTLTREQGLLLIARLLK